MQEQPSANRMNPQIPAGVQVATWIMVVTTALAGVILPVIAFLVPSSETLLRIPLAGFQVQATTLAARIGVALLTLAICTFWVALSIHVLRGRMWAYYTTLVLLALDLFSGYGLFVIHARIRFDAVGLVFLLAFVLGFRDYRRFAEYQQNQRGQAQGEPGNA